MAGAGWWLGVVEECYTQGVHRTGGQSFHASFGIASFRFQEGGRAVVGS